MVLAEQQRGAGAARGGSPDVVKAVGLERPPDPDAEHHVEQEERHHDVDHDEEEHDATSREEDVELDERDDPPPERGAVDVVSVLRHDGVEGHAERLSQYCPSVSLACALWPGSLSGWRTPGG